MTDKTEIFNDFSALLSMKIPKTMNQQNFKTCFCFLFLFLVGDFFFSGKYRCRSEDGKKQVTDYCNLSAALQLVHLQEIL